MRDPAHRADAVGRVARRGCGPGLGARALTASPLPGPSGNVEYFAVAAARRPATVDRDAIAAEVARSASWGMPGEKAEP